MNAAAGTFKVSLDTICQQKSNLSDGNRQAIQVFLSLPYTASDTKNLGINKVKEHICLKPLSDSAFPACMYIYERQWTHQGMAPSSSSIRGCAQLASARLYWEEHVAACSKARFGYISSSRWILFQSSHRSVERRYFYKAGA